jgi:hypothetical protein
LPFQYDVTQAAPEHIGMGRIVIRTSRPRHLAILEEDGDIEAPAFH